MEHLFCPECWAAIFAVLATWRYAPVFFRVWAAKWQAKLMLKHTEDCKGDVCHHDDHGDEK